MIIPHISVSRKRLWNECQQKYKYQYHLQLPSGEPEPFYFVYGSIIHKIAEDYVSLKGEKTLNEIKEEILQGERPYDKDKEGNDLFAPEIPLDYKRKIPEHLTSVQNLTDTSGMDGYTELKFEYDLDPPNEKKIVGFIDRIFRKGDDWFIVDYKTTKKSRWRKNRSNIIYDEQLRVYARVLQKKFDIDPRNIYAGLLYLEGNELVGTRFKEQDLIQIEESLLKSYNEIKNSDPNEVWGSVGDHCRRCEYRKICPFYSITGEGVR